MHARQTLRHRCWLSGNRLAAAVLVFGALICGISLTAPARARTIRFALDFVEPAVVTTPDGAVQIEARDCVTFNEPGLPLLPARRAVVLLPPGEEVVGLRVYPSGESAFDGTYRVAHAETPRPISATGPFPPTEPDPAVYGSNDLYPAAAALLVTEQIAWGHGLAFLRVFPVAYRPMAGELVWYERITVEVETQLQAGADPTRLPNLRRTPRVLTRLTELVLNPQDLALYEGAAPRGWAGSRLDPDYYPYVIVTPQQFVDDFQPLADFEATRGLRATIMTVEQIAADYPGYTDIQESIRYFIIDAYQNWQTEYVLLGGDHDLVEERDLYVNAGGTVDRFPGDCYFEGLDGSWNDDGDGRWGEPGEEDLVGEIAVGRASASNAAEISNWLHKNMMYTEQPVVAEIQKALFVGERLDNQTYGGDSMDDIRSSSSACGYSTTGYPSSYTRERLYERDSSWDKWDILALMNDGFPTTHHLGHSNTTYCMKLENPDTQYFTNDGVTHSYMFNYSQGCYAGDFDNGSVDCVVEALVHAECASAAFIANSRYGWYLPGTECGPSQHYDREFADARFDEGFTTAGWMNVDSKADCVWQLDAWLRWCHYELNLFGDPALPQWHDVYGTLALSHAGVYNVGQGDYEVTVTASGSPVSDATVTMYSSDFLVWVSGQTNGSGVVRLDPGDVGPMTLYLKAIKSDYLPAADDLVVVGDPCVIGLISPNGGESFCSGDEVPITWETGGTCGAAVSLELLQGGGVCATIAASTPNDGSYTWSAAQCDGLEEDYTIRVIDLDSGAFDDSQAPFTIYSPCELAVLSPNGGEFFLIGDAVEITWSFTECCGDSVALELLQDGMVCLTIAEATEDDGAYIWSAAQCAAYTDAYQVRVVDIASGESADSDGSFEIWPPCTLTVSHPNGGEVLTIGDPLTITWDQNGACGSTVEIALLRDGSDCLLIDAATDNDGEYAWTVEPCGSEVDGYRIRVLDTAADAGDESDEDFSIRPPYYITAITDIPADQGGAVQVDWLRCAYDTDGETGITGYEIYRRQDERLPVDGWDLVATLPASGDSLYQCAAPTVCDSTVHSGICWSVFFVRAVTTDPEEFYDTPPDSGYSVDNLAPAPPENFHLATQSLLIWNTSPEEDLDYYTVYGSENGFLDSTAVTIGTTTDTTMVIPEHYPYFHCTATDFAGNEGQEATVSASGIAGGGRCPTAYALYQNSPNPGRPATSIAFDLPRESHVLLRVYDLTGRALATLVDAQLPPGSHTVSLYGARSDHRPILCGAYFYRLEAEGFRDTKKMLIIQ